MNYAAVFTYIHDEKGNYNKDVVVYLFETEQEAKSFLEDNYTEQLKADMEQSNFITQGVITDDFICARIQNIFDGYAETTEMVIGKVYS